MNPPDEQTCRNCGAGYGRDDIFCESCGYDFITGSLPSPDEARALGLPGAPTTPVPTTPAPVAPTPAAPAPAPFPPPPTAPSPAATPAPATSPTLVRFEITVDRAYFDAVVSEGELAFPDPVPGPRVIEKVGTELHLGRTSQSRAIHPDLDIAQLTGDPAVSSRHAVIRVGPAGELSVTDVGSTNGTIVGAVDAEALVEGEVRPLASGDAVYVGAWTRLVVTLVTTT